MLSYVLTFIEGILTFISPCLLPMLPVYFIYLAGTAEDDAAQINKKVNRMVTNSIGFALGFTIVFVILGATATALGHFLDSNRDLLRKASGIVIIFFGLYFLGVFKLKGLDLGKRINIRLDKLQFSGSILFGVVFSFSWTPCLSAFLGPALVLAGNSKRVTEGIVLLLLYSAGLGLPFIVSSIIFDKVRHLFIKIQKYNRIIGTISGLLLITAGILVYTDSIKYLSF